ncbi:LysM peptidoglycan-binding domain-containing protein [Paenibacillus sp. FSL H8-0034]|uniref:LysM peptidoglycan-binding domain-containing protein n=1 Tax=Paenibacillus sp. FSL H8-0034 TaxID=2954671 RepID=UPI0030F5EDCE
MKIHMVKKGDTLYEIAKKYNVDLDKLIASNPQIADPNVIEVGMKVKIPNAPMPVIPPTDYLHKHVVVQGDTLWKLGKSWNVPLQMLITANPQLKNPNILMTGEVVYIPKVKPHHESHQHENDHPHQPENEAQHQHTHHHHNKPNTAPIPVPLPAPAPIAVEPAPVVEQPEVVKPPVKPIPMPEPIPNIEFQMPLKPPAPYPEYLQPEAQVPPVKPMKPMQQEQPQFLQPEAQAPNMKPMQTNQWAQPIQQEQPQFLQPAAQAPAAKPANPWTEPMQSNPWTEPMQSNPWTEPMQSNPWTQPMQSNPWTEPMQSNPWTEPMQSNPWTEPMHSNPWMHPMVESTNAYPCVDNYPSYVQGAQTQAPMWGHHPHDMNLFQQYQEPATEVFTHDNMNAPMQPMWSAPMVSPMAAAPNAAPMVSPMAAAPNAAPMVSPMAAAPYSPNMPMEAGFAGMPNYPFYQQPQSSAGGCGCGCGGPVANIQHHQVMPYAYGMPNAPMPYETWPHAQSPAAYGEMPGYSHGYEPMNVNTAAANSAYPGSVYPMSMQPQMVHPYGWSPYGAGVPDCGCNSKYELEQLLRQQSEAEARAKAEISTQTDSLEANKVTIQNTNNNKKKASISTRAAKPAQRNRRSTNKTSKATSNSPWLVR